MSQEAWPSRYLASIALAACVRGVCCVLYRYAVCGMRLAPCALHVLWPELTICFVVAWYGGGRCWELVLVLAAAFPSRSSILRPSGRRAGQSACLAARLQRPRATLISQAPSFIQRTLSLRLPTEKIALRLCVLQPCLPGAYGIECQRCCWHMRCVSNSATAWQCHVHDRSTAGACLPGLQQRAANDKLLA